MDAQLLNKNFSYDIQLSDTISVSLDEKLFLRALENLTNNAFRYTSNNGNITIKSFINEKTKIPTISIKDDGQGISKKDLPFIFDPLYRGTNSRREEGKGLGLSVVKTVVDCHGWNLYVKSEEGKGSEFIIQLGI
jgi:signal transduction histidine kinase